jgi:hypothetical protein
MCSRAISVGPSVSSPLSMSERTSVSGTHSIRSASVVSDGEPW